MIGSSDNVSFVIKQEAQRGPSEDLNTAHFPQYSPRSRIEGFGSH